MTFEATNLIIGILLLLALAAFVAKRRMFKIDHEPPEHRAMENELSEAFGLQIPHVEEPKDHKKKEKEVEKAFEHATQS